MISKPHQAAAGAFTGKIKKAVKYGMVTEPLSVMDKLKMLKDLGFDGVEPGTSDALEHRDVLRVGRPRRRLLLDGHDAAVVLQVARPGRALGDEPRAGAVEVRLQHSAPSV